ncbi:MAG: hypothetical protein KA748_13215 [Halomonas sp.]|nr:hypothetical protein [Halomonas sp.]
MYLVVYNLCNAGLAIGQAKVPAATQEDTLAVG